MRDRTASTSPAPLGRGGLVATTDAYRIVIGLLMLITISRIHQHFKFLAPLRPALTLVLLAGLYALMNPRFLSRDFAPKTWSWKVITAMAVIACLSVPFGISMGNSGMFIIQEYSKTILFAMLVLLAVRHTGDLLTLLWALAAAGGVLAWLSIFVFEMQVWGGTIARIQNAYTYDSNDLGLVMVLCAVITVLLWQIAGPRGKLVSVVLLGGLGAAIARTGSRGAFLTLVVVGAALLVLVRGVSTGKKLAFVAVVAVCLLWAAPAGYWDQMRTILEPKADYNWSSETGRKKVTRRGFGYMLQRPVFGLGVDNFGRAEGMLSERAKAFEYDPSLAGVKWIAPHNSFMQAGAEMGIPGLVLFSTMVFGSIYQVRKLRKRMRGWDRGDPEQRTLYFTSLYLPVAFIGFAVGGSLVSFAYMDPVYVLVALVGGLQISYDARTRQDRSGVRPIAGRSQPAIPVPHPPVPTRASALPPPERVPAVLPLSS